MMNKLGQLEHIDINPSIYIYIRENTEVSTYIQWYKVFPLTSNAYGCYIGMD